ncbi:MAG: SDR family oxidoreductase [Xanthomonadaceae bacterium]|nr:SDR family oxidoreductase [Xanthomonadaceae bacterium]
MNTPFDFAGCRIAIAGGSRGIGRAIALAFLRAGAGVAVCARGQDGLEAMNRDAGADAGRLHVQRCDLAKPDEIGRWIADAANALGGIDVLVNNAGIGMRTVNPDFMTDPMAFWRISPDGFRDLLATNVLGYFLVARAVVPHMLEAGRGKIVNISINESTMRRRGFTPYGPSRAATDALSHIMAADLAGTGIDVNLLLPGGATRTGMTPDSAPAHVQATWLDPAIMGPPICWLASRASDGLTDQRIVATEFADHEPA